jgi:hypothetical protein
VTNSSALQQEVKATLLDVFGHQIDELPPNTVDAAVVSALSADASNQLSELRSSIDDGGRLFDWVMAIEIIFGAAAFIKTLIEIRDSLAPRPSNKELLESAISGLDIDASTKDLLIQNADNIVAKIRK